MTHRRQDPFEPPCADLACRARGRRDLEVHGQHRRQDGVRTPLRPPGARRRVGVRRNPPLAPPPNQGHERSVRYTLVHWRVAGPEVGGDRPPDLRQRCRPRGPRRPSPAARPALEQGVHRGDLGDTLVSRAGSAGGAESAAAIGSAGRGRGKRRAGSCSRARVQPAPRVHPLGRPRAPWLHSRLPQVHPHAGRTPRAGRQAPGRVPRPRGTSAQRRRRPET